MEYVQDCGKKIYDENQKYAVFVSFIITIVPQTTLGITLKVFGDIS